MKVNFSSVSNTADLIVVFLNSKLSLSNYIESLASENNFDLKSYFKSNDFTGKKPQSLKVNIGNTKVLLYSIGKNDDMDYAKALSIGGKIYSSANSYKASKVSIILDEIVKSKGDIDSLAEGFMEGFILKSYKFEKYKTKKEDEKHITDVTFVSEFHKEISKKYKDYTISLIDSIFMARDFVSEPPNVLFPEEMASRCEKMLHNNLEVEVLNKHMLETLGMNTLLGVAQGSANDPTVIVMKYNGGKKGDKPLAFLGKGVTFDTGGISLKPANGMESMKYDMAGSATVIGLMNFLASRKAKVNAIGIVGMVENMPDGLAQRPSDVVTSLSGQTVEILNTDAEGRLVLADILWYCQDRFKPKFMINLATLTGAVVVALGSQHAGLFSNNDKLAESLTKSGLKVSEKLWRLPMSDEYDKLIDSDIADVQNTGDDRGAGSIVAAQFLQRFVNKTDWAHLDIAGMAWAKKDLDFCPKGATGFGIRLLNQLVMDNYE